MERQMTNIADKITESDGYCIGALIALYHKQTTDEQQNQHTTYQNNAGFNAIDARFMSSVAEQYLSKGFVTEGQLKYVRKSLYKYANQLSSLHILDLPIKKIQSPQQDTKQRQEKSIVQLSNDLLAVSFPYNAQLVQAIKTIPGRKWNKNSKHWEVPLNKVSIDKLSNLGFTVPHSLDEAIQSAQELGEIEIPDLKLPLFPFQKQGVSFIEKNKGVALVADQMGLGKTCQALAWLQLHPEIRPAIIICPASVKLNWRKEAYKFMSNPQVQVLSGTKPYKLNKQSDLIVINYDILSSWVDELTKCDPSAIIWDECHYVKSSKAKRTRALIALCRQSKAKYRIALSGTPIVNRPVEIYPTIKMLRPSLFPSYWHFVQRYCNAKMTKWGWDYSGSSNTQELHEILTTSIMIRRRKDEVLADLPPKLRTVLPLEIKNRPEYNNAEADFLTWVRQNFDIRTLTAAMRAEALVRIEKLKQLCLHGKIDSCVEWIQDFLDDNGKLVVFCTHTKTVDRLMNEFQDSAVKLDGSTPPNKRQEVVDEFQTNPEIRLFVGNIRAAGVGITLTAASSVCFLELGWTPGEHDQAEDRCHRISQHDNVNIYYLVADNTIEEWLCELIDDKRKVLDAVLDGTQTTQDSMLMELLDRSMEKSNAA